MTLRGFVARALALKVPVVLLLSLPLAALRFTAGAATFPALVGLVFGGRWVADQTRRREAITRPYEPRPILQPTANGWYWTGWDYHRSKPVAIVSSWFNWVLRDPATWRDLLWMLVDPVVGTLLLLTALLVPSRALRWHADWTRALLGSTGPHPRNRRLGDADALDAQAVELERIERDLHDGAQARLVAIGLSLSTAQRSLHDNPTAADELLTEARASASAALGQLRDLVHGIRPPVLTERGLADALRLLALDQGAAVSVDLPWRLPPALEAAMYFSAAELIINAAKHADTRTVQIDLTSTHGRLKLTVSDDGRGGADPAGGTGLAGVRRRVGSFGGTLQVVSPSGGPTVVTVEVPCEFSSPKTSSS
jgi:signal transduction histidine kinase